ncbi:hypothetical protein PENTCL1PPCAC_21640, partial [Pristionchus entomophagus]
VREGQCRGKCTTINTFYDEATKTSIAKCQQIQGQPIIIRNEEQKFYWKSHVKSDAWTVIGLVCRTNSTEREWADGSRVDYKSGFLDPIFYFPCLTGEAWVLHSDGNWSVFTTHMGHQAWSTDVFCST